MLAILIFGSAFEIQKRLLRFGSGRSRVDSLDMASLGHCVTHCVSAFSLFVTFTAYASSWSWYRFVTRVVCGEVFSQGKDSWRTACGEISPASMA